MQAINITESSNSPKIFFDEKTNILFISGDSYPENSFEFYKPLLAWLNDFFNKNKKGLEIQFSLVYFNSTTSKVLYDIFDFLEENVKDSFKLSINWFYDPENELALEAGEDYKEDYESLDICLVTKGS